MTNALERIWVWPFNVRWSGGYWRIKTQAPETEAGGFWAVPEDVVEARIAAAVKAEREACAWLAKSYDCNAYDDDSDRTARAIAADIRARGEEK